MLSHRSAFIDYFSELGKIFWKLLRISVKLQLSPGKLLRINLSRLDLQLLFVFHRRYRQSQKSLEQQIDTLVLKESTDKTDTQYL
ncbi:MAG: hypothetical protein BWY75_01015 [bacterium ADurb.Bin425]|nr:MAG: hypothetical protein BWY75_01015 [bacterium ADurb.Bin425]